MSYRTKESITQHLADLGVQSRYDEDDERHEFILTPLEGQEIVLACYSEFGYGPSNISYLTFRITITDKISHVKYDLYSMSRGEPSARGYRHKALEQEWIDKDVAAACKEFRKLEKDFPCFIYSDDQNEYVERFPFEYPIALLARTQKREDFVRIMRTMLDFCILNRHEHVPRDLRVAYHLANEISKMKGYGDLFIDQVIQLETAMRASKELIK